MKRAGGRAGQIFTQLVLFGMLFMTGLAATALARPILADLAEEERDATVVQGATRQLFEDSPSPPPPPPPSNPRTLSITVDLGDDCVIRTPSYTAVLYNAAEDIRAGATVDFYFIISNINARPQYPTFLTLGVYTYRLTYTTTGGSTSSYATGTITVVIPTPQCRSDYSPMPGALPSLTDLYAGALPNEMMLVKTIGGNPTELVAGATYMFSLTARQCGSPGATACTGSFTVQDPASKPSTPLCNNVTLPAVFGCARDTPPGSEVGSSPNGYPLTLAMDAGLGPLPVSSVPYRYSLTAKSPTNVVSDPCYGTIKVEDQEPLDANLIDCPGVSTIVPLDARKPAATFTATYRGGNVKANGCSVAVSIPTGSSGSAVTCDRCNKPGVHEAPACTATVAANKLTVTDTGGARNRISWRVKATDALRSETRTCGVCVENPAKGAVCTAAWVPGNPAPCP